ncbi:hypothetical protein ERO13_D06G158750v2 [Gossypium hirsutum]|nr:hypothetical protein ERO13_D06G158750v2 [Gossypium hirsutum]
MDVSLDKGNSTVCMVENVDPNAGISSKIMKDGGRLLLHRKGSFTIPSDTSLHGSCFGLRAILGDETHAKGGMLVPLNEVVKSSTHRLESIASDGSNLMIEEEIVKGLGGSTRVGESRQSRSKKVDLSNENIGKNLMPRKPKGSSGVVMTRPRRLFTKNTSLRKVVKPYMGADTYPVLEGQGSW